MLLFIEFSEQILPLGIQLERLVPLPTRVRRATEGVHLADQIWVASEYHIRANASNVALSSGQLDILSQSFSQNYTILSTDIGEC
jgi:hypothetical protein